jgi:hypothetical protein
MDLQARIEEIQARINRLRKIIEEGEVENRPEPETTVKETIIETKVDKEKLKSSSEVNDLKSKLMKKK